MVTASGNDGGGIELGVLLNGFATAVLGDDEAELSEVRQAIADTLGGAAMCDTAGVASLFNAIVRVADATGIPMEDDKAATSEDFRAELGINNFAAVGEKGPGT